MALLATNALAQTYVFQRQFGGMGNLNGQLSTPIGVAIDAVSHNILVADSDNSRIEIFNPAGGYVGKFGNFGAGDGQFNGPFGVAIDPTTRNVLVTDNGGNRVLIFDSSGNYQFTFGQTGSDSGQFVRPTGIAIDPTTRNVVVADSGNNRIQIFAPDGTFLLQFGTGGPYNSGFQSPSFLSVDPVSRNIVVADSYNSRVQVFSPAGRYITQFGTLGNGNGQFGYSEGIAIDPSSQTFAVTDPPNNRVEIFNSSGNYLSQFGSFGTGPGQFRLPAAVAIDPTSHNIVVSDWLNNRIQIFSPLTCTYSIAPTSNSLPSGGGSGTVSVTATSGCPWTARSNATWIAVTSGASGSGNGVISYSASANSGSNQQIGTLTIAGQTFALTEAGISAPPAPTSIAASVLPSSRSVQVGGTATAFAILINTGSFTAVACTITPATSVPATFSFQTTDPMTNALIGSPNSPVNIAPGAAQTFVIALAATAPFSPTDIGFSFACSNAISPLGNSGLNTLLFSSSVSAVPDVVALAATVSNNGIVNIPGINGTGALVVASVNVGATAAITVSGDTGSVALPTTVSLCQTIPQTGQCITPIAPTVTTTMANGSTPTFAVFVAAHGQVPFSPGTNRIFVRFKDSNGTTRGSTSVAVQTSNVSAQ